MEESENKPLINRVPLECNVMQHYRMLNEGEIINFDDEALQEDGETWLEAGHLVSRCKYNRTLFLPIRRKLHNDGGHARHDEA